MNALSYQFTQDLRETAHQFSDSVAVYSTFDKATYLFNEIVIAIMDYSDNNQFTIEEVQQQLLVEDGATIEPDTLHQLLKDAVKELEAVKLVEPITCEVI